MAVTSTLAVTAIQARDAARDQRREAEGLVAFMLGDLKDKLEPIGKLDALDGVGAKVLAYYSKQDTSELSDAALAAALAGAQPDGRRSPMSRGNVDGAQRLYREAMTGTAEAISAIPTIRSGSSTMPRTYSGSATSRGSAAEDRRRRRACANISGSPTEWSRSSPTT